MGFFEMIYSFMLWMIGRRNDVASSTGSLHAKSSDIRNQLGSDADTTSSTGSVHAKLKDIKVNQVKTTVFGTYSTSSLAWVTALNISGQGVLKAIKISASGTYGYTVKLTVDGVVLFQLGSSDGTVYWVTGDGTKITNPFLCDVTFKSSLKIEITVSNSSNTASVAWQYQV